METRKTAKDLKLELLDIWTPELAWWLGCVYGDGCVHEGNKSYRVVFGCSDNTTTEKWRALICPDSGTQWHNHKKKLMYAYVDDRRLVEWFKQRGIVGEKSSTLTWPSYMPTEFDKHFLRGLWDTDGSVCIERREMAGLRKGVKIGRDTLKSNFTAKNKDFVFQVVNKLSALADVDMVAIANNVKYVKKYDKTYTWHDAGWSGAPARKVVEYLYNDAPEHIRGSDRYNILQEYLHMLKDRICEICQEPAWSDTFCQTHWWENRAKNNLKPVCPECLIRDVHSKGVCLPCYKKEKRRLVPGYGKKPQGTCACGSVAFKKKMCNACYSRNRREEQRIDAENLEDDDGWEGGNAIQGCE